MKQINWGIIGLGAIAAQFAIGFSNTKNAKLLGIASKSEDRLKSFKNDFKIDQEYCFSDYRDLIKNQNIDIIYIALPTSMHFEWAVKCLKEGKKVLIEKPATLNSLEAISIKENFMTEESFCTEAFMYLYHPQIKKTLELIREGEIGELISMESYFGRDILTKRSFLGFKKRKKINSKNRLYNKKLGGGAILDLGCYPVSFSSIIAATISKKLLHKISIFNKKKEIGATGVDIDSYAELKFNDAFSSKIGASFIKNLGTQSKIKGSKGELIIEDTWSAQPSKIIIKNNDQENIIEIDNKDNIYSYEIEAISKILINKKLELDFLGLSIDDTIINMKIIDSWMSQ